MTEAFVTLEVYQAAQSHIATLEAALMEAADYIRNSGNFSHEAIIIHKMILDAIAKGESIKPTIQIHKSYTDLDIENLVGCVLKLKRELELEYRGLANQVGLGAERKRQFVEVRLHYVSQCLEPFQHIISNSIPRRS